MLCDLCLMLGLLLGACAFPLAWGIARLCDASPSTAGWVGLVPVLLLSFAALIGLADELVPLWIISVVLGLR